MATIHSEEQAAGLELLESMLREEGVRIGLLGPNEGERIRKRHIEDALRLLAHVPDDARTLVDVGSGAGLPGLPIAVVRRDLAVTLLEPQERRCRFLRSAAEALGLGVAVVRARAEDFGQGEGRERFDVGVSRALGPGPVVLEYVLPLVRPGGICVALRGRPEEADIRSAATVSALLGGGEPAWVETPAAGARRSWVLSVPKHTPTPEKYPRRAGIPSRRPLR